MELGMVGLGKMGANMVRRLMRAGHQCAVYDRDPGAVQELVKEGAKGAAKIDALTGLLKTPRAVWVMVPAGAPTEETVAELGRILSPGDAVIDGGNTHYWDDVRRAKTLKPLGIDYIDAGTSGGVWGLERGYCLMIGGDVAAVRRLGPIFKTLAPGRGDVSRTPGRENAKAGSTAEEGYLHCGPAGAGHFVKMVHNGIEYGVMQAYGEGFDILKNAFSQGVPEERRYKIDVGEVAEVWRRGSVIGSWLLDLTAAALLKDPDLSKFAGFVHDSGEGRWTIQAAIEEAVPADVLSAALYARFRSRQDHTFTEKILSAMRAGFGGHKE